MIVINTVDLGANRFSSGGAIEAHSAWYINGRIEEARN